MSYALLADGVVVVHLAFIVFATLGGFLVLKHQRWIGLHLPAVIWATVVECFGWGCPLTPLEKWLRKRGGGEGYEGGFIEHYILPILYPSELTRAMQIGLGLFVVLINLVIYAWVWRRSVRNRKVDG